MRPHPLLYPVFDKPKAATGVADGKVVYPAAHHQVNELYHPTHRLGVEAPENIFDLAQQCGALLKLGRIIRPPPLALQATMLVQRPWERQRLAKNPYLQPDPPWGFWEKGGNFLENFGGGGGN